MTLTSIRSAAAVALALAAGSTGSWPALAQTQFQPVVCPAFPSYLEMPFQYAVGDQFGMVSELPVKTQAAFWSQCPSDPFRCGDYLGSQHQVRPIFANQNVSRFSFSTWAFDLEPGYDYVEYGDRRPTAPSATYNVAGRITDSSGSLWWRDVPLAGSLQENPAFLRFHSDGSLEEGGLATHRVRLSCATPASDRVPGFLVPRQRATGFLLGNGDVVHFLFEAGSESSGESNLHQTIALWAQGPVTTADFDVYLRCNAKPTPTAFDFRGFSTQAQEFLHLTPDWCAGGLWFAAVHAFQGSGQFNLVQQSHRANGHINVTVAFDAAPTAPQLASWEAYLRQSARYFFGMSEGTVLFEKFAVFTGRTSCPFFDPLACGGTYCNVCLDPRPCPPGRDCRAYRADFPNRIQLYSSSLANDATLPHEMGHYALNVPDEYEDATSPAGVPYSAPKCGHSVMALAFRGKEFNVCYDGDHDADRITTSPAGGDSAWKRIRRNPLFQPETPDNHPFDQFNFNGFPIGQILEIP